MPYDSADLDFSHNDADADLPAQAKAGGGIISAFRDTGRAILTPIKRAGGKAVLSAMMAAAAVLCAPHAAKGQCYAFSDGSASSLVPGRAHDENHLRPDLRPPAGPDRDSALVAQHLPFTPGSSPFGVASYRSTTKS